MKVKNRLINVKFNDDVPQDKIESFFSEHSKLKRP